MWQNLCGAPHGWWEGTREISSLPSCWKLSQPSRVLRAVSSPVPTNSKDGDATISLGPDQCLTMLVANMFPCAWLDFLMSSWCPLSFILSLCIPGKSLALLLCTSHISFPGFLSLPTFFCKSHAAAPTASVASAGLPPVCHSCWGAQVKTWMVISCCERVLLTPGQRVVFPSAFLQRCCAGSLCRCRELSHPRCGAFL